jgi:hypothetical protein
VSGVSIKRIFTALGEDATGKSGWLLTGVIFALAAVLRLTSLRAFLAHDETIYWEWSRAFFLALLQGNWQGTIVGPGNPSVTLFWNHALNMGVKYIWAWLNGVQATALATWPDFQPKATLDLLVERRLPIVLFNTLAVVFAYRLVHRLYGRRIALCAAVLLALDPFYLADARTSRGEGLLASLLILAILTYLTYWTFERPRYLFFSGVLAGLALLTKTSAVSLVVWTIVATPALALLGSGGLGGSQLKRILVAWITWGLLALAIFWALWPAMWVAPGKALSFLLSFISNVGVSGRDNYFWGQVYQDKPLPSYYLVVYILRVTPLAWLGLLAAFWYLGRSYFRRPRLESDRAANLRPSLTALILAFALIYGAMMTVGTLKRDWYLLPAFPALDIVAAVGLIWVFQWVWDHWGKPWVNRVSPQGAWSTGLIAILVLQVATTLPAHPYYYTYWNPVVLGSRWAARAVMVGWDLDLSAGAHYLNSKPHAENLRAATHSTRGFEQIFQGHTVRWVPEQPWIQADYLIIRRLHLQLQKLDPALLSYVSHLKLDHVVTIGGVDYLWIYEGPRAEYFAGPSMLTGKAILLGYDLGDPKTAAGDTLSVKLYWQNKGMVSGDDLFLHLVDAAGHVWAAGVAVPLPGFEEAALTNDQIVESQVTLMVPVGTPPGTYFLASGIYSHAREETLGYFTLPVDAGSISVARATHAPAIAELPMEHKLGAKMSPEVSLLGFDLPDTTLVLNNDNWLTLYWQANTPVDRDYVIGLQLLDLEGEEATYWLGRPVMSGYPTSEWMAGEIVRDPWRLELPAETSPGDYTLHLTLFDAETQAAVGQVTLGDVSVVERRREFEIPVMQKMVNIGLGDRVTLLGYDLFAEPITGGGRLRVTLYWQAQEMMGNSYTVFVHLLGPDGTVVAQHDGMPVEGAIPTDDWAVGEVVADRHLVEFLGLPAGEYSLVAGMYNPTTGERLPTSGGDTLILLQTLRID